MDEMHAASPHVPGENAQLRLFNMCHAHAAGACAGPYTAVKK